jgi:hypothetical protein
MLSTSVRLSFLGAQSGRFWAPLIFASELLFPCMLMFASMSAVRFMCAHVMQIALK